MVAQLEGELLPAQEVFQVAPEVIADVDVVVALIALKLKTLHVP